MSYIYEYRHVKLIQCYCETIKVPLPLLFDIGSFLYALVSAFHSDWLIRSNLRIRVSDNFAYKFAQKLVDRRRQLTTTSGNWNIPALLAALHEKEASTCHAVEAVVFVVKRGSPRKFGAFIYSLFPVSLSSVNTIINSTRL